MLKRVSETTQNGAKEQKRGFLSMSLGTLGASLLWNKLVCKEIVKAGYENKKGKEIIRAGYVSKLDF